MTPAPTNLHAFLEPLIGARRTAHLLGAIALPEPLRRSPAERVSRAELSLALAMLLFEDLLVRVPMARAYLDETVRNGGQLVFDHGALRTVAAPCGALPPGDRAFARLLEPLGYAPRDVYPLPKLRMTGQAWTHVDLPEDVPQYFVSQLHPERFSVGFQEAVQRVVGDSVDPLGAIPLALLRDLARDRELDHGAARRLLPELASCFERQHARPRLRDYEILLDESPEMAWIATEGNAFNHATDRVDDVAAVAELQRRLGRPMKASLEVSASGRVIQTAFRAAEVDRLFIGDDGHVIVRRVPGSFHEFITRLRHPDGRLDLAFDAGNAQGIFKMTAQGADA
ncbi:MAG: DUF1338 family protein [Planctomycetes bacterium]|nr:DUF1338 family protein [Planctomycetota bacterium]